MSMPRAVRHINEIRVLEAVFRTEKVSRANIARELGLTRSTASSLVAGLAEEGVLIEDASGEDKGAGTGRPGTFLRLNPRHGLFLGADIGVGYITIVALDFAGSIVAHRNFQFETDRKDFDKLTSQLAQCVAKVMRGFSADYILRGLSVIVPGVIDHAGVVLRAPLLGWKRVPLLERLSLLLPDMPVILAENDANAFALAHAYVSQVTQSETNVYIFLDAGVGGAVITGGQLLRGNDGYAGEFGHIILGGEGFVKLATPAGSLESYIGHEAVLARHRHYGGSSDTIDGLIQAARAGEAAAVKTIGEWAFHFGRGVSILSSIFNPSQIMLGGRVAAIFELCADDVMRNIKANLIDDQPVPVVTRSPLGLEGPALGGASMLHRRMFSVDKELVFRTSLQSEHL